MRNPSASLGLLAVALLLTACGSTPTSGGNKQYKIGFVYPTLNNPFFVDQESGANAAANEFGAKVIHVDGQNKVDVQTTLVENFIAQKVDALIVQPVDTAGIVAAINEATTAKVPVFTTGEEPNGGTVVTKVVFDETQNGVTAGTLISCPAPSVTPRFSCCSSAGDAWNRSASSRTSAIGVPMSTGRTGAPMVQHASKRGIVPARLPLADTTRSPASTPREASTC